MDSINSVDTSININGVDIEWDLEKGKLNFLGISATLFWNDPSLLNMFKPLVDEIGKDMFCLQVAYSSSLGTEEDYHAMVTQLGDTFEEGFINWGKAVSGAGWGTFELSYIDFKSSKAKVIVHNPWELVMQKNLAEPEMWGCPFLQGKIIGIFNNAFKSTCWAKESYYIEKEGSKVEFDIYLYDLTLEEEISKLKENREKDEVFKLNKIIEEKTKEQELLLSLFDTGDAVLFNWNNDSVWSVRSVSSNVSNIFGFSKEDFDSKAIDYRSCIHKDDLKTVQNEVTSAGEDNVEYFKHKPYRIINKNNETKWVLDHTTIVRNEKNEINSYIGLVTDITELKQKDEQLLQQFKMAQMGELMNMIAHQWRQPLSAIAATSAAMEIKIKLDYFDVSTKEGQDKQELFFLKKLADVSRFVQDLTSTIDDFRNFYKPTKKSSTVYLEGIVEKSLHIIKASFINNKIEIIENYECIDKIEMYENEMMQVILNILTNAQEHFIDKKIKSPKIIITTKNRVLSILDNGGGIPEDIIDSIFEPYFSTKSEKNGTGLGLYMSKTIVEKHHNGCLNVENKDGGACFTIKLKSALP